MAKMGTKSWYIKELQNRGINTYKDEPVENLDKSVLINVYHEEVRSLLK